jgi:HTH-type transcriptional regulator/antitoxin HigA
MNLHDVTAHRVALHETLGLGAPIADDEEYGRALRAVDEMVDATGGREEHPLQGPIRLARRFSVPAQVFLGFPAAPPQVSAP